MPEKLPLKETPAVVEKQLEQVKEGVHKFTVDQALVGKHRFKPSRGLPVWINYAEPNDPFELYEEVTYENGPVKVVIPKGFKCDATSTPWQVFLTPAAFQIAVAVWWLMEWSVVTMAVLWAIGTVLSILVPWIMPSVGQIGLHIRAATVHDALFRTQVVARVVADAVMWEIMQYDKVRRLPRWIIYLMLRLFGGRAWRANAKRLAETAEHGREFGAPKEPTATVEPISEVVSPVTAKKIIDEAKP